MFVNISYRYQEFRRALVKMFAENDDQDCVFMECSKNLKRHPHMIVECVPLERELGDMAPIYFKVCKLDIHGRTKIVDTLIYIYVLWCMDAVELQCMLLMLYHWPHCLYMVLLQMLLCCSV